MLKKLLLTFGRGKSSVGHHTIYIYFFIVHTILYNFPYLLTYNIPFHLLSHFTMCLQILQFFSRTARSAGWDAHISVQNHEAAHQCHYPDLHSVTAKIIKQVIQFTGIDIVSLMDSGKACTLNLLGFVDTTKKNRSLNVAF